MKLKFNNKYVRWGVTAFLVIAAGLMFYYVLFHGEKIFQGFHKILKVCMPVVWGLIMGYLLTPILNFIEKALAWICKRFKIKESPKRDKIFRGLGILITWVLVISVLYFLISMLVRQIIPSVQTIINDFDNYVKNITTWLNKLLEDNQTIKDYVVNLIDRYSTEIEDWLNGTVLPKSSELLKTLSLSVISFLHIVWDFIIGFVISIYVLASKEIFAGQSKKIVYGLFETETANEIIKSMRFTHHTFIGFISGKIVDSIIIGLLCFIGVSVMDTPYPALISVIIGVTNVIPFFGPYLGAIPSAILILLVDFAHPLNCVYFLIFILILQQIDGNIIGPRILGNSTGLSGFWVIFSITVFGGFFGVTGMIIGVPTFAVLYAAISGIINKKLKDKEMTVDTGRYITVGTVDEDGTFHEYVPEEKMSEVKKKSFVVKKIGVLKERIDKKRKTSKR